MESVGSGINRPDYLAQVVVYLKKYLKFIVTALIIGAVAGYCVAHF